MIPIVLVRAFQIMCIVGFKASAYLFVSTQDVLKLEDGHVKTDILDVHWPIIQWCLVTVHHARLGISAAARIIVMMTFMDNPCSVITCRLRVGSAASLKRVCRPQN